MNVLRIGPGRETSDDIELPEQAAHNFVDVLSSADMLEPRNDSIERNLHFRNGTLRVEFAVPFEALLMFQKLFSVEIGDYSSQAAGQVPVDRNTGHAAAEGHASD